MYIQRRKRVYKSGQYLSAYIKEEGKNPYWFYQWHPIFQNEKYR